MVAGSVLKGRLGLETARVPHVDRHGLMYLSRGNLTVEKGTLRFATPGSEEMKSGIYSIPFQMVSILMLGPGSTVSHDAMRLCARHGTSIVATGEGGVRAYTAPPLGPDNSRIARYQATAWANQTMRLDLIRRLYAWRLGEVLPHRQIEVFRGIEGARMKILYQTLANQYGIKWKGRRYDRANPNAADCPNQAINHSATAVESAAAVAVISVGALPQLGFIHEASGNAFILDIADLYRGEQTIPIAFRSVKLYEENPSVDLERHVRRLAAKEFKSKGLISKMIDRIKELFDADVRDSNA